MKKIVLTCILNLVIFSNLIAQQNFQPGFVILNSGDTLIGTIDNKYWKKNPVTIDFKNSENKVQAFGVNDIIEFQVEGSIYKRAEIRVETSPVVLKHLEENSELEFDYRTVFLEALFIGPKSLYSYKGEWERDHFFIENDGQYITLIYKKYLRVYNGQKLLTYNREYKKQLEDYLMGCPNITKMLKLNKEFIDFNLRQLFKKYYKCSNTNYSYQKSRNSVELTFGFVAGIASNKANFKGDIGQYKELINADIAPNTTPTIGISLNLLLESNRNRWSIYNELTYSTYSVNTYFKDEVSSTHYFEYYIDLGASYINLNNMIRYSLIAKKGSAFFIETGITNGYALNIKNTELEVKTFNGNVEKSENNLYLSERKYEQGYLLGLGFSIRKIALDLRYNRTNGISYFVNMSSTVDRFSAVLGYSF